MEDVIRFNEQWFVAATSSFADDRTRVLKHNDTFGVFDRHGEISHTGGGAQGLYHAGTRHLSLWELKINGRRPVLLNSTVKEDNSFLTVDMTTPDIYKNGTMVIAKGAIHLFRSVVLWDGARYEHLRLVNYDDKAVEVELALSFSADYADIFEVRGSQRQARGRDLPVELGERCITLGYRGLDETLRRTRISFDFKPEEIRANGFRTGLLLEPAKECHLHITAVCDTDESTSVVAEIGRAHV